jgi:hypothetical protein
VVPDPGRGAAEHRWRGFCGLFGEELPGSGGEHVGVDVVDYLRGDDGVREGDVTTFVRVGQVG